MNGKKNIEGFNEEILVKYLNGETNSQENLEVESWLNEVETNRRKLETTRKTLKYTDVYYKTKNFNSSAAWENVHAKINTTEFNIIQQKNKRKEALFTFYKYAAIVVIALLLGSVGYFVGFKNQKTSVFSEVISAEKQIVNNYVLPDGSLVTLNSNSQLLFPKQFEKNVREVTIIGEAFFDVKPNPEKPFIINAGNAQVKVLGTSFNVCAYPETETVEVVVESGKVQVTRKKPDSENNNFDILLVPGEKGTLFTRNNLIEKSVNADPNILAWKTHDLVFNQVPLSEVIQCLEKVYHIQIQVMEPEINSLMLTAHFDKKPVDFILNVMRLTFNLELSGENEQFTLASRKINN